MTWERKRPRLAKDPGRSAFHSFPRKMFGVAEASDTGGNHMGAPAFR